MKGHKHRPNIFIGSSTEQRLVADALKLNLDKFADCHVWHETFPLSQSTLDTIILNIGKSDFGVFILSDDDLINIRNDHFKISRDNVIFEAGISIGILGKERTFLVVPNNEKNYHLPTDLLGVTLADYRKDFFLKENESAMGAASIKIESAIKKCLWSNLNLSLDTKIVINRSENIDFPLKIWMTIINNEDFPITCESKNFSLKQFTVHKTTGKEKDYKPEFFYYNDKISNKDIRGSIITLFPKLHSTCYIPIEPKANFKLIKSGLLKRDCGHFQLKCILHKKEIEIYNYDLEINTEHIENSTQLNFAKENLIGKWENKWSKGSEKLEIKNDFYYFTNDQMEPSFEIKDFHIKNNKIEFLKKSCKKGINRNYENNLILIDQNTMIGTETLLENNESHDIRYTRFL